MWYQAGADITIQVDYEVDGEFVIPNSASVTLYYGDGTADTTIVNQPLDVTSTSAPVTIPSSKNQIPAGKVLETRYLVVSFVYNGNSYQRRYHYKLIPFVPLLATPDQVRAELGVDDVELPDDHIDLYRAYLDIKARGDIDVDPLLSSGSREALVVNEIIVLQAAINLMPSLRLRVSEAMTSEDSRFQRFRNADFDALEQAFRSRLNDLVASLSTQPGVAPTLLMVSSPKDPVTGR